MARIGLCIMLTLLPCAQLGLRCINLSRRRVVIFDVVPLELQALLPVMVSSGQLVTVRVQGGTDVRAASPLDYLIHVMLPLRSKPGASSSALKRSAKWTSVVTSNLSSARKT